MLHLLVSCLTQKVAFIKSALRTYFLTHENSLNPLVWDYANMMQWLLAG